MRPGRIIERDDLGEKMLSAWSEAAGGTRLTTCPWWALRDPFVIQVLAAHRWFREGQLALRWPVLPEALARGLEVYDTALLTVQANDAEAAAKKARDEAEERMRQLSSPQRPPAFNPGKPRRLPKLRR